MSPSETVRALLAEMDAGDFDALRARLEPGFEFRNPMVPDAGPDEFVGFLSAYRAGFPEQRHDVAELLESGSRVAVEGEWVGVHSGPLATPDAELPPTGRTVRSPFAAIATTRGERVASLHLYMDVLAFTAQLGVPAAA